MAQQQPARRKMQSSATPATIPDKLYFRIGDVATLCGVPTYVLRFWETEFSQLKPNKGGTGQRLYRKRDVEMALEIRRLLYDEGFTIAGARRLLTEKRRQHATEPDAKPALVETREMHSPVAPARAAIAEPIRAAARPEIGSPTVGLVSDPPKSSDLSEIKDLPKIKNLREEMRELLSLLGSEPAEPKLLDRKPTAPVSRRETKKSRRLEEPTLF